MCFFATPFAEFFNWIFLEGIILLTGTFKGPDDGSQSVRNLPLLVVSCSLIGLGMLGMCLLWLCKRKDSHWLLQCLFIPGASHGLSGLTTTLVNIYFNKRRVLSSPSIAALVVASTYTFICIFLAMYYAITRSPKDTVPTLVTRVFIWLLLQGFLLLAGSSSHRDRVKLFLKKIRNPPLFGVAFGCVGIGVIGMCSLWWYQRKNYKWLYQSLFTPGMSTGFAGLTSTLVNLLSNEHDASGVSTPATLAVVIGCIVICTFLTIFYWFRKAPEGQS